MVFADMGLSAAVMHQQNLSNRQFSSFYWLNLIMGFFLMVLTGSCSPLVADYYNQPELSGIISFTCILLFTDSIYTLQRTIQQKNLNFKFFVLVDILSATSLLMSNIILAINGFGIYSLVYSSLIGSIVKSIIYLYIGIFKEHNIEFHFNLNDVKQPLTIGVYMVGSQILDFFSSQMDSLIVSSSYSMEVFGVYTLCKSLASRLFQFINPIVSNVLTPILATIQSDKKQITDVYFKCIDIVAAVNFPIYSIIAYISFSIISILYGESYSQYAFLLACFSFYYAFISCNNPVGSLTIATGHTDYGMYWTIFRVFFCALYYYIISSFSLMTFAIGVFVLPMVTAYPFWRIVFSKITFVSFYKFFLVTIKPFLCCIPLAPIYFVDSKINNPTLSIIIFIPTIVLGYICVTYLFRRQMLTGLVSAIRIDFIGI